MDLGVEDTSSVPQLGSRGDVLKDGEKRSGLCVVAVWSLQSLALHRGRGKLESLSFSNG